MDTIDVYYLIFVGVYILIIIFPTLMVKRDKMRGGRLWDTFYYIISIIVVSILPLIINYVPYLKDSDTDVKRVKLLTILLAGAISVILTYLKLFVDLHREYKEMKEKFDNQMNSFLDNPILKTKESLDSVSLSLFNIKNHSSRESVRTFFIGSLDGFNEYGAVHINASFSDYTKLLSDFMGNAGSVIGTFTSRPIDIKISAQESHVKEYLAVLKKHKNIIRRICVLEPEEIRDIKEDMKSNQVTGKTKKSDTNEIQWFLENVPSKGKPRWDNTENFLSNLQCPEIASIIPERVNKMVDFAIFDDVLLRWSPDENYANKTSITKIGAIVVLVGEKVHKIREALEDYLSDRNKGYASFEELSRVIE